MKKIKQVCKCEKCGNEAEMELTCEYEDNEKALEKKKAGVEKKTGDHDLTGKGVCVNCGGEADMWIDI
jgi:hypothetical protein